MASLDATWARTILTRLSRTQKGIVFLAMEICFVPVALWATLQLQPLPDGFPDPLTTFLVAVPYLLMLDLVAQFTLGLPSRRLTDFDAVAFGHVGAAAAFVAAGGWVLGALSGVEPPMALLFVFWMLLFLLGTVSRIVLLQVVLAIYRRGDKVVRVLIYGAGTTGTQLVQALRSHQGIDPVAFVDDSTALKGKIVAGLPVYAPARIQDIVRARRIHRVLLAVPSLSPPKQARIARRLQKLGLEVQTLPSFAQLIGTETLIDKLEVMNPQIFLGRAEVAAPLAEVHASYAGNSVLVSGAGGSIGSELCRQLIEMRPAKMVLYEISEFALFTVQQELATLARDLRVEIVPVLGSVADGPRVRKVLEEHGVEVVLHAAAYKHVYLVEMNPLAGLANNVLGTQVLGAEAVRAGVKRFILVSSDKAVRPRGVMGASKRLAELVIQDLATRVETGRGPIFSMVRFGNVLGSSGSVVPIFYDQIRRGGPVTVTHPEVTRYFMTIQEAVRLVLRAGAMSEGGDVFLLDMGKPMRIVDLARAAIEASGYTVRDAEMPQGDIEIQFTGLREGEKLHEELFLDGSQVPTSHHKIYRVHENLLSQIETADILRALRRAVEDGDRDAALDAVARRLHSFRAAREGRGALDA